MTEEPKKARKKADFSSILKHWDERRHMKKVTVPSKDQTFLKKYGLKNPKDS